MPISKEDIITMAGKTVYSRGEAYFIKNRVKIISNVEGVVISEVQGSRINSPYHVFLEFSEDGDEVLSCDCSCPAFEDYGDLGGICKHIVATMLKIISPAQPNIELYVKSDRAAVQMLNTYIKSVTDEVIALNPGDVRFEPVLEYDNGLNPSLLFRAGNSRMYLIPDLSLFRTRFHGRETAEYGKSFSLLHSISSFCEDSKPMVSFFLRHYDNDTSSFHSGLYGVKSGKRNMGISPIMADELFSLLSGKELLIRSGTKRISHVPVKNNDYRPRITLRKVGGGAILSVHGWYILIKGARGLYVMTDDGIFCCGHEFKAACEGLLLNLSKSGGRAFFSERDIRALFSVIVKKIRPHVKLVLDGEFDEFNPVPLVTKIYFDSPEANSVTAKMTFNYGDKVINAFDAKSESEAKSEFEAKNANLMGDIHGEILAKSVMKKYFGDKLNDSGDLFIKNNGEQVLLLVSEGLEEMSKIGQIYSTDSFRKIRIRPPVRVTLGVRVDSGLLNMDFDISGVDMSEFSDILESYRLSKKYHRLKDGSFVTIQEAALSGINDLAEGFGLSVKQINSGHVELPQSLAMYLDSVISKNEEIYVEKDQGYIQILKDMKSIGKAGYKIPEGMDGILRNYQKEGFLWLKTVESYGFGGILADDMGLGKTIQILTLFKSYYEAKGKKKQSIVICPSSLMLNWESEAKKFTPELRTMVITGSAEGRSLRIIRSEDYDLLITSYDLLKRDIEFYEATKFRFVIIDEAQYIKNQFTQNAKAVKALNGQVKFALTGTPVENSLAELWSIFDFLMPGYLFNYSKFRKQFEEPAVKNSEGIEAERLRQMVRPFMLRRLKSEVLKELPPKTETVLRTFMNDEQRKIYMANMAKARNDIGGQAGKNNQDRIIILAALTRLRQICCDPSLLYENYKGESSKLEACMELVESCALSGRRMLIFSGFTSMLTIIGNRLNEMNMDFLRIDGSTPSSSRLDLVNKFNDSDIPVFLISLKAGGTGLNLTGADVVIHYDPWWNLSAQNQATDRAHRIGQQKNVQVYKLISKDTIEERILYMQEKKAELAGAIIEENINPMERLNRDELLSLFEG